MTDAADEALLSVRVTEVGEFIRHHSCPRRFKLELNNRALGRRLPFSERLFNTLDPVLREEGRKREGQWERYLRDEGLADLTSWPGRPETDEDPPTWEQFVEAAAGLGEGERGYGREVVVSGRVGEVELRGRIDFLIVTWLEGQPRLRIVETKASRRDRTYHRIQVALYKLLVLDEFERYELRVAGQAIGPDNVECVVGRIDEASNESQLLLELDPLDLSIEEADVRRLLASNGRLVEIDGTPLDDLPYELGPKCDGCVFNVDCLPESALHRRHELLAVPAPTAAVLREAGLETLDDLAELDADGPVATQLRTAQGMTDSLDWLVTRARTRRTTLPGGEGDPDAYEVQQLRFSPTSQLPEHRQHGQALVRVYVCVDYDYTENRIGALSAHVTNSGSQIHTGFRQREDQRWEPDPRIHERHRDADDGAFEESEVSGRDVVVVQQSEWSGHYDIDTGSERALLQQFVGELIDAIADVAEAAEAPIHLYVWSRSEMAHLVEACSRAHTRLLGALNQLLGCRRSLEQLIYSSVGEEVDRRFALGWTGRGLAVVSSLRWFGRTYHWRRRIGGVDVDLDRVFEQDIFDFKTTLGLSADGTWADDPDAADRRHRFEIRSRFFDSLTAPYWRALWGTLPDPASDDLKADEANAIRRYNRAAEPGLLRGYLMARTHALRWVEEGIRFKNDEIGKPPLRIADLRAFDLNVNDVAQAGIDFLRLDHFVAFTDWVHQNFTPVASRVPTGRTIPLVDVTATSRQSVRATIDVERYGLDLATLRSRCPYVEGSFVRLAPHSGNPLLGQTFAQLTRAGSTCKITRLDWEAGEVELDRFFNNPDVYVVQSNIPIPDVDEEMFSAATLDESVSDYAAGRVEARLRSGIGTHVYPWFDPTDPQIPERDQLSPEELAAYRRFVDELEFTTGHGLVEDQANSVVDGVQATVQLLQGPPGTGKTQTCTAATVARIARSAPEGSVVLVAANTHTAIDNLLVRLADEEETLRGHAANAGLRARRVRVAKVHSSHVEDPVPGIENFPSKPSVRAVNRLRTSATLIVGGTTSALLKLADELSGRIPWRDEPGGFQVPILIMDEASMMVFPHFLALASMVEPGGEIMLAGDHRQLSPILAHDWEREDRPPTVHYQPYASAYEAVRRLEAHEDISHRSIRRSSLELTFRLPSVVVDLIARLYALDEIELQGLADEVTLPPRDAAAALSDDLHVVWGGSTGLYLVLHSENRSQQSNEIEADIIH